MKIQGGADTSDESRSLHCETDLALSEPLAIIDAQPCTCILPMRLGWALVLLSQAGELSGEGRPSSLAAQRSRRWLTEP